MCLFSSDQIQIRLCYVIFESASFYAVCQKHICTAHHRFCTARGVNLLLVSFSFLQGGLMAPQFNPYLSSAHGPTTLSLHR